MLFDVIVYSFNDISTWTTSTTTRLRSRSPAGSAVGVAVGAR